MKLGDIKLDLYTFEDLNEELTKLDKPEFKALNEQEQYNRVNRLLLELIRKSPNTFLLRAVVEFITTVRQSRILDDFTLTAFEIWLNQFSGLSEDEEALVRGKIVGRFVPRDMYQSMFPIGMGKRYQGSHFVAAHSSPDLDTTIASFWGWIDAFAAKVSTGSHIWNVPGGPPTNAVEIPFLFQEIFGENVFECIVKTRSALTISSLDLLSQRGVIRKKLSEPALSLDHERQKNAVVLVDEEGYYLGDWRSVDIEGVRQVIMLFNNVLRWYEGHLHMELITLFAKQTLTLQDISPFIERFLRIKVNECEPVKEFTLKQSEYLEDYLVKVLGVSEGVSASFETLSEKLNHIVDFSSFVQALKLLETSDLFDAKGKLNENRPLIFAHLDKIVRALKQVTREFRLHVEKLSVSLAVKSDVFGYVPQSISHRTDIDEIHKKMDSYSYLTVNYTNEEGRQIPVGVVYASALQQKTLGTVSLRDFCNREEVKIPSSLEVISVIDHHKTQLTTSTPPLAIIADYQSSNSLVAKLSFEINDQYSTGGMTKESIDKQLKKTTHDSAEEIRVVSRLLKRKRASSHTSYFVSKEREMLEYLQCLYAIFDDTDLLTKVSMKDVQIVASLINRLKSLQVGNVTEVINFDDLEHDPDFTKKAAKRLLQNEELHSLYAKVYSSKEDVITENLKTGDVFSDTKVLSHIARVGQIKLFAKNHPTYLEEKEKLRALWYEKALKISENTPEIDLHMQMVSTIPSADELFTGDAINYDHHDEIWIYIPQTTTAADHLATFLSGLAPTLNAYHCDVALAEANKRTLASIFRDTFPLARQMPLEGAEQPIAILSYPAGRINSRKSQIAPHLSTQS
ncbi:MAG: hypothetical protein SP1CHLAM54_18060 [Chlamydiia bacterium]|nr:hypothetical protein [Chlamydiia bacterium]MCH9616692.1 hypothetical protein [Chlamydiia bacterium]MCH9629423.1 hypothetical protein [Chlamydiia bacterium]